MESFLKGLSTYFNRMPDYRPKNLEGRIRPKCEVAYFPVDCLSEPSTFTEEETLVEKDRPVNYLAGDDSPNKKTLHIVWPHRWEHDKDPDTFFSVMKQLKNSGHKFHLSVIGETFTEKPKIFDEAESCLKDNILNWGYKASKEDYYKVLKSADVVVSTAIHEFFGVAMLEAISFNCYPLCPKRLVYPEIYPDHYLYNTPNQLFKRLRYFCEHPGAARYHKVEVDMSKFSWQVLKTQYRNFFIKALA